MLEPTSVIGNIYSITKLIYGQLKLVKVNQEQCKRLAERVEIIEQSIRNLENNQEKSYQKGLSYLLAALQTGLEFMQQLSTASSFTKFFQAGNYNQRFIDLNEELQKSLQQLNLGLVVQQAFDREKDKLDQQADIEFMRVNHKEIIHAIQKGNAAIGELNLELKENHDIVINQVASLKALLMSFSRSLEKSPIDLQKVVPYFELVFDKKLCTGSFGQIYLGTWRGQVTVIKSIEGSFSEGDKKQFIQEVEMMSECRDKHITQFYGACLEPGRACLLMEHMERGSLYQILEKPLPSYLQKQMALEIAKGLQYLHTRPCPILHRNLKSTHILVNSDNHAKLSDLGLSQSRESRLQTVQQKSEAIRWLAPECFTRGTYTKQSDIYSYGVILWELLSGKRPYPNLSDNEIRERTLNGERDTLDSITEPYADLIKQCWSLEPTRRPTIEYIINILSSAPKEYYNQVVKLEQPKDNISAKEFSSSYQINHTELEFVRELGRGGFGVVYQGTWRKHTEVAIKQLMSNGISSDAKEEFDEEIKVMMRLRSPNIIQFYGYCPSPKHCIVMEYMPNGSLFNVLKDTKQPLDWSIRIRIAIDIAAGLNFLHHEKIMHRDIKSLNVLLDKSNGAKLTDFGLSKIKKETQSQSMAHKTTKDSVGTIAWMAPELFKRKAYTKKSDIYSLGITFWELAARRIPYSQGVQEAIPGFVIEGEREEIPADCPQKLSSLIKACWDGSPDKRPDAGTVVAYLKSDANDFAQFDGLSKLSGYQDNLHYVAYQDNFNAVSTPNQNIEVYTPFKAKVQNSKNINLIAAIKQNDEQEVLRILNLKVGGLEKKLIEESDAEHKGNAIYWAAHYGYAHFIEMLIKAGVDPNKADKMGITPMQKAFVNGHPAVIMALKDAGVNIDKNIMPEEASASYESVQDLSNHLNSLNLIEAVKKNNQKEFFRLLNLEAGGLAKMLAEEVDTLCDGNALYWAAHFGYDHFIGPLFKAGVNLNKQNKYGRTAVYEAACNGHPETIVTLKSLGANVEIPDSNSKTPLYAAAENGHIETILTLKAAGVNIDIPDKNGETLMHFAAKDGKVEAIVALKAAGVSIDMPNNKRKTPLYLAAENGHTEAIIALKKLGALIDSSGLVAAAARNGHVEAIKVLSAEGANVSMPDSLGAIPIHSFIYSIHSSACKGVKIKEVISVLIGLGANVNARDKEGRTPLFIAAMYAGYKGDTGQEDKRAESLQLITALVVAGASVDAADNQGNTSVHAAIFPFECVEVIAALKAAGANVNIKNKLGQAPIWRAAEIGCEKSIAALSAAGAYVEALDKHDHTPLYAAVLYQKYEAITALLKAGANPNISAGYFGSVLKFAQTQCDGGKSARLLEAYAKQCFKGVKSVNIKATPVIANSSQAAEQKDPSMLIQFNQPLTSQSTSKGFSSKVAKLFKAGR